ncbi:MAG TPA: hypothetical protein VJ576_13425 [Rhodocyclaceae bacterium]|nr:hypothetical protein [Rhodocyclaceae bacterium]
MTEFASRPVEIHKLPLPAEVQILHPELALLLYYKSHTIDVGALCYLRRRTDRRRRPGQGRQVDLSSFSLARAERVRAWIEFASQAVASGRQKVITVDSFHRDFIAFMDWCDGNGHSDVLDGETPARVAFRAYVEHLRRLVSQHELNNNSAASDQNHCRDILSEFLGIECLDRGVNLLMKRAIFDTPTPVPSDDAQGKVIAWCQCLFSGISDLVVDEKPYPFAMTVPEYLHWPGNRLWLFPSEQWCKIPDSPFQRRKGGLNDHIAHDYDNGTIYDLDILTAKYGERCTAKQLMARRSYALLQIKAANRHFRSRRRVERALLAVKTFMILFVAATGMNPAQVVALPWSTELDEALDNPLTERQGFRSIKYRANNRTVHFEIGVQFMPHFRRYLELRRYLLDGCEFELLFVGFRGSRPSNITVPLPQTREIFANTYKILRRFDGSLPKVMPRQWRAAKQDHLVRHHDVHTAARLMQHSIRTAVRKYSNGSEMMHQTEMGNFLTQVEKVVLARDDLLEHGETRSIGLCASPNHPSPISGHVPVTPDCKGPEGCLFCGQYRVHADEVDTRKLLSCRYCIRKTSHLASSQEQFDRVFGVVLNRIGFILSEIGHRDATMVARIEREVDVEGELDPYWTIKLETLMELDLV